MCEIWKDIEGYNGKYQVSNLGNVRSTRFYGHHRIKVLKPINNGKGYYFVTLVGDNNTKAMKSIHRLVAGAFLPNDDNLEMVNHKDENPANNHVDNLEWCTRSYNQVYSMNLHDDRKMVFTRNLLDKNGKFQSSWTKKGVAHTRFEKVRQSTYDGEYLKTFDNASDAARHLGVKPGNILHACKRNARTDRLRKRKQKAGAYGFVWEFEKTE